MVQRSAPKTVLGFFAGGLSIWGATTVGIVYVLSRTEALLHLVPFVVVVMMLVFVVVIGAVFALVVKNPAALVLGQVTGQEYVAIQKLAQGDSVHGEFFDIPTMKPTTGDLVPIVGHEAEDEDVG